MNLRQHIPDDDPELKELILLIAEGGKKIQSSFIKKQGVAGTQNIYDEEQVEMDVWADQVLGEDFCNSGLVAAFASEERPEVINCEKGGKFSVVMDPLDGSSLMGINLSVGTIIGIYAGDNPLLPGREMVAAMYVLYGPLTTVTYTVKKGVHEFALDAEGEFVLQHEDMKIGSSKIYAPGALRKDWLPGHKKLIEDLEGQGYKLRFSGSFVADVHQILHKGGMFTYPGFIGREQGKLRLVFELNPMGFIVTQAGGSCSVGTQNNLDLTPEKIDHRVPVYVGGRTEIELAEKYMKGD